jgi:hypothetical protein
MTNAAADDQTAVFELGKLPLGELPRRGYVATLTLRNTRGIDVLASNADATKSVGMQVKTCRGVKPDWILTAKAERRSAENLCYVSSVYRIVVRRRSTSFRGTSLRSRCVRRMNNGRRNRVVTDFRTAITRSGWSPIRRATTKTDGIFWGWAERSGTPLLQQTRRR